MTISVWMTEHTHYMKGWKFLRTHDWLGVVYARFAWTANDFERSTPPFHSDEPPDSRRMGGISRAITSPVVRSFTVSGRRLSPGPWQGWEGQRDRHQTADLRTPDPSVGYVAEAPVHRIRQFIAHVKCLPLLFSATQTKVLLLFVTYAQN